MEELKNTVVDVDITEQTTKREREPKTGIHTYIHTYIFQKRRTNRTEHNILS